ALGLEPPTSWDEVFSLVEAAAEAGEQPIMLGNLDQWPALHVFGPLQAHFVDAETIVTLGMGNAGADWTSDDNLAALTQLADWGSSGVLGDSPNGLAYDDAWPLYTEGKGVLLIGGSWLGPDMEAVMGEDLRFMAPPPGADGTVATTGGTGIPFSIPSAAENPAAAAAFIDFITSDDAMAMIAENGGMPVNRTAELAPDSGVNKDIYEAFDAVSTEGTLLPYLDYATPSFADTAGATLQELIGGQTDPAGAAEALQEDYGAFTEGSWPDARPTPRQTLRGRPRAADAVPVPAAGVSGLRRVRAVPAGQGRAVLPVRVEGLRLLHLRGVRELRGPRRGRGLPGGDPQRPRAHHVLRGDPAGGGSGAGGGAAARPGAGDGLLPHRDLPAAGDRPGGGRGGVAADLRPRRPAERCAAGGGPGRAHPRLARRSG